MLMANPPHYPDTDDTGMELDRESTTGTARWVYVVWIIGITLIVLMVVLHLTGTISPGHH
jgi:hypothetical protein